MKKLSLDLDAITVESFHTIARKADKGTVLGYETRFYCNGQYTVDYPLSCDHVCDSYYCTDEISCAYTGCGDCSQQGSCDTCAATCEYTCPNTCNFSCGC
jgi:hypothetical protein